MSWYVQNSFSLTDKETLDRPDFRPYLHPSFVPEQASNMAVNRLWDLSQSTTSCVIDDSRKRTAPRIRRQDLEDFLSIWLRGNYRELQIPLELRQVQVDLKWPARHGHWKVENWEDIGDRAVMIVEYKTFRPCVRYGAGSIILSTADVDHILSCLLSSTKNDEIPRCAGGLVSGSQSLQWLIVPVEQQSLKSSIDAFRSSTKGSVLSQDPYDGKIACIAELLRREADSNYTGDPSYMITDMLKLCYVTKDMRKRIPLQDTTPPATFHIFRNDDLVRLFGIVGDFDNEESGPLPLDLEYRAELILTLSPELETMDWTTRPNEEEQNATNGPALAIDLSQCTGDEPSSPFAVQPDMGTGAVENVMEPVQQTAFPGGYGQGGYGQGGYGQGGDGQGLPEVGQYRFLFHRQQHYHGQR